ncbi:MAG: aldo/keto reductase, partial [Symbiobacteriaceae bacterium]|nr:aldo/keto reductase [Symbiobacteriaceae bacterium]
DLLLEAHSRGVTFFDTAESYRTYPYLRELIAKVGRQSVVIATKSYAVTAREARDSLQRALDTMATDYIDIFMLHEQLSSLTIQGHAQALEFYIQAKQQGLIRAVGLSTHFIAAVRAAIMLPEIEIIEAVYNPAGFGIQDGSAGDMLDALEENRRMGKGICAIKVLGGGHLIPRSHELLPEVSGLKTIHSLIIGMQSSEELRVNLALINGEEPCSNDKNSLSMCGRALHIADYCMKCGLCVSRCPTNALTISGDSININRDKCFTCGYCGGVCPQMAIKIY